MQRLHHFSFWSIQRRCKLSYSSEPRHSVLAKPLADAIRYYGFIADPCLICNHVSGGLAKRGICGREILLPRPGGLVIRCGVLGYWKIS